jgi:hypothetical protein
MSLRVLACCSLCSLFAALMLQTPAMVSAGPNENARILLHLTTPVSKNACSLRSNPPGCSDIDTSGELETDYFAYVILSDVSSLVGVGLVRFGIAYDGVSSSGVDISSWTSCGTSQEFPYAGWPAAGGGNALVWTSTECLPVTVGQFPMFVAGYFQLSAYSPDELRVTPHPMDNKASVAACDTTEDVLINSIVLPLGWAVFSVAGTAEGSNPCGFFSGSCHISGPDSVGSVQTGIQYVMNPEEVTPTGSWTIQGNAEIASSNNSAVTVNPTSPGTFWITYQRELGCAEGCGCTREVQVLAPTPVQRITWGRIKAGLPSH